MITFVYAQDLEGGIGYQGTLPWDLPNDMKFFKETTMGHTMLMGRKTFDGMNQRLLPGRKTVVMTRNKDYGQDIEGLQVVHNVEEVLELAKDQELMVIGGAHVFLDLIDYADRIVRTVIEGNFPHDVFMPQINEDQWELISSTEGIVDDKNLYKHQFEEWKRKDEVD